MLAARLANGQSSESFEFIKDVILLISSPNHYGCLDVFESSDISSRDEQQLDGDTTGAGILCLSECDPVRDAIRRPDPDPRALPHRRSRQSLTGSSGRLPHRPRH
ncbi:hypothetical protein PGTUg99_016786 [Puccinia graminis f. sp. tritici]|uniref:Uncharacterized protein n=1 Tax=Puccinia graminis f. sp. tritici TaxID=56615 RepID=A0A5B0S8H5_PUCGR|nr:hypothetical protein PGTUg99_016786 [Puccinia graminis f. sp. tritici]